MVNPLIVALDVPDLGSARRLADSLAGTVGGFKVGLELLMAHGVSAIESIADRGLPVFADAKLHDIPNTVHRASRAIHQAGARWLTVHASGGATMIEAATDGMGGTGVLAVTVLTSLDRRGLATVGVDGDIGSQVGRLVGVAADGHAEGVVCSPHEAGLVRDAGPSLAIFTPGVRPAGQDHHDQARVATPSDALAAGADYLVVGRPITGAADPVDAAGRIMSEITPDTGVNGND